MNNFENAFLFKVQGQGQGQNFYISFMERNLRVIHKTKFVANILKLSYFQFFACDLDLERSSSYILYLLNDKELRYYHKTKFIKNTLKW